MRKYLLARAQKITLSAHVLRHTMLRRATEKHGVQYAMELAGHPTAITSGATLSRQKNKKQGNRRIAQPMSRLELLINSSTERQLMVFRTAISCLASPMCFAPDTPYSGSPSHNNVGNQAMNYNFQRKKPTGKKRRFDLNFLACAKQVEYIGECSRHTLFRRFAVEIRQLRSRAGIPLVRSPIDTSHHHHRPCRFGMVRRRAAHGKR